MSRWKRVWVGIKGTRPRRYRRGWQAVKFPNADHYSEHFSRRELNCKCGCVPSAAVQKELTVLAEGLEALRALLGPLTVLSGHRCLKRNVQVGGAIASKHMTGEAADLHVPFGKQDEYVEAATKVPMFRDGGVGVYPNGGVHVDHRGYRARWSSWSR